MLRNTLIAGVVLGFLLSAGPAGAQKIDANGRCHDAAGKFAKAEVCGGASATKSAKASKPASAPSATAAAKPAAATAATTTAAKGQKCRNDKGKFVKCGSPGAHPA